MESSETNGGKTVDTVDIWLTDLTYTQQAVSADLIPSAIGGIATYTESMLGMEQQIRLFKYPEKLAEALEKDGCPRIIGFSNYVWNSTLSCRIAERIKEVSPETIIIFGGPHFSLADSEKKQFLEEHPFIDFYIVKEAELAFAKLVEQLIETNFDLESIHGTIGSIHSIDANGNLHAPLTLDRIRDLADIPSPYLDSRLDEFFDGKLLPIIQTNRGCPFSCTFCVEGTQYYNKIYRNSVDKISQEIDYIGKKMEEVRPLGGRNDLFIADSNFGMYKQDIQTCEAIAEAQSDYSWPDYINVATGKNQKERVLKAASLINGALRLSGSVQSLDSDVLANIKRKNIAPDQLMQLALDASDIGANSYSETILCLPGDSKEKHVGTLKRVIEAGFNMVSTFQLMLLPGSEMCSPETKEQYGFDTRFRVFPRCYGHFDVLGKRIVSAEIEEVCVALNTLTFEEYLECRRLHLLIHIFHNDGIFGAVLKFLRTEGLPVFRWIEILAAIEPPKNLANLLEDFLTATKDELWDSEEELDRFIQEDGNVERYIEGEIGNNLLFTFKTSALTRFIDDLADHAHSATLALLKETGRDDDETVAFINDAIGFQRCRALNIFDKMDITPSLEISYDIPGYEADLAPGSLDEYALSAPRRYDFVMSSKQKDLITRYLGVFGNTPWGIGRMLTKVFVKKLLRNPESQELSGGIPKGLSQQNEKTIQLG